ncbi:hypothetical protein HDU96_000931 [Phlyctochytrium bullatum]|nr:hypothetical protein HDU96_000931 [Phlyctochytrium bullatum]
MREESGVTIWPPSPPHRDDSVERGKKRRKAASPSSRSDNSDKEVKKKKKKSKSKKKKKKKRKQSSSSSSSSSEAEQTESVPAPAQASQPLPLEPEDPNEAQDFWHEKPVTYTDELPVGPIPMPEQETKLNERAYGGQLLQGEGSAMAAYLQSGKRIPRRGEIGLTSEEIESFEDVGYVMSGSRHRRMNAVRIRKENQVISAEEKNALLLFSQQEMARKEAETIAKFKELVANKLNKDQ